MGTQWYVAVEGEQKGPLSDKEIRRWVNSGQVSRDTFVRVGTDGEWLPASDYDELWPRTVAFLKELSTADGEQIEESPPTEDIGVPAVQPSFAPSKKTRTRSVYGRKKSVGRSATYRTKRSASPSLPFSSQTVVILLVSGVLIAIGIGFVAYAFNMKEGFDRKDDRTRRAQEATERLEDSLFRLGIESDGETPTFEKADRTPFYVCVTIGCIFIGLGLLPLALLGGKAFT